MKKKGETKRQRILIYYALAIVLPCLILGILALRGVKNDQALLEREQRSNLQEAGQKIILKTEEYLLPIENSFKEIINIIPVPQEALFTDSLLTRFTDQHKTAAGIFYLSGNELPYLFNKNLLYVPDNFSSVSYAESPHTTQNILEKGWQIEFRENNNQKALKYYQSALPDITSVQFRGEILNTVARLQKKLNLDAEAVETYDLLWNEYPDILIQNKIPLGAVALVEKSLLYLWKNDTVGALKTAYSLLTQIHKSRWKMGYSFLTNFISKVDEIIYRCENSHNKETTSSIERIRLLKDSVSFSIEHTEYLLAFQESGDLITKSPNTGTEINNHRHKILVNGRSYFFSLFPLSDTEQWGLIMDQGDILNKSVHNSILDNADKYNLKWEVTDVNGTLLLQSGYIPEDIAPVNVAFPAYLPSWSLTFYPENSGLFVSFLRSGEGIFFYIFIAIVVILAFGLFFTLQTVNNELHLSKMKSYFISTVSHEFKSPLTSIRQMAEMLVNDRVPSPERQQKYFTSILKQSERLSHLIENILDFSKMEEGKRIFHFEKADITQVVRDIVESFRYQTAGQGFKIDLFIPEPLPDIVFDREAIGQVMHNLIDNAIKYSGDARNVGIQLLSKGNKMIISVRDYGIGISKEDQEKVFGRFYRAGEELTQSVKGSGIGLTIVKQLVEAHNGTIDVESEVGKGSMFRVRLPIGGT